MEIDSPRPNLFTVVVSRAEIPRDGVVPREAELALQELLRHLDRGVADGVRAEHERLL